MIELRTTVAGDSTGNAFTLKSLEGKCLSSNSAMRNA